MATSDRTAPPAPRPAALPAELPVTSAQPGGGFLVNLELAWGRLRRAWLRRVRPGYVRRMQALRQGECAQCPHDVVDPRDLKYYRNVCGYTFPADARPRRRWLPFAEYGLVELVVSSILLAGAGALLAAAAVWVHALFWIPLAAVLLFWAEVIYFFRDPERTIPTTATALLSPADGTITHVGEVDDPDFPEGRAFRISIFLSIFNVHVNRVPRSGRVVNVRYFSGCFLDARHRDCATQNEQLWLDLEEPSGRLIRVKQIVGLLARRIVCWARVGEVLRAGARYGMIKFGSRTDVLLPVAAVDEVLVKVGDKVQGGSTILLHVKDTAPAPGRVS